MPLTKISGIRQLQEGRQDTKTLQYEEGYELTHPRDLITKETLDPINDLLSELAPPNADSMHGKALTIYNSTTSKKTGYLSSDAAAAYKAGNGAGSQVNYIINDADFVLETPDPTNGINEGDEGLLELYINNVKVDEFDLGAAFDENYRSDAQVYTPANSASGYLTITDVRKHNDFKAWQKAIAHLNISQGDLVTGYNSIVLKHTGLSAEQVSQTFDVFYDVSTETPVLGVIDVRIHSNNAPKYLSGVRYLGSMDAIKVSTTGDNLFDNTYVQDPITFYGFSGAPTTVVAPADGAVSGLSNPPQIEELMTVSDKIITLSQANQCSADARLTGRPKDPFGTYPTAISAAQKLLVSTFSSRSNNTTEHFDDEDYRLPLSWNSDDKTTGITGHWDSEQLLSNGDAQQYVISDNEHGLVYPNTDFTVYQPANTADYDAFSGDQKYLRCFLASSPKASIGFTLYGLAGGISPVGTGDVNLEIKLPTQTGWLDCAKPFDGSAGVGADGLGCLVGSISYTGGNAVVNATFGGKSSYDANGRVLLRITLRNGNRSIKQIGTNW